MSSRVSNNGKRRQPKHSARRAPTQDVDPPDPIAADVTRRNRDEQKQRRGERLALLGNFAAGIAHEVNNPLGAALASTQAALRLLDRDASPALKESLETALASVRRCSSVVDSLLRFCREEPALRQTFDLHDVIRFVESLTYTYATDQQCRITLQLAGESPTIHGNPLEMEIVLVNLVRNAVEAGAKEVVLSATRGDGWLDIRVADDGGGVAEADADRLCDPLFTTRREQGGTGLGLSVVHSIIQELGGTIEFAGNTGRGATVCLKLPASSQEAT